MRSTRIDVHIRVRNSLGVHGDAPQGQTHFHIRPQLHQTQTSILSYHRSFALLLTHNTSCNGCSQQYLSSAKSATPIEPDINGRRLLPWAYQHPCCPPATSGWQPKQLWSYALYLRIGRVLWQICQRFLWSIGDDVFQFVTPQITNDTF
jgi:hypothetical protein